MVFKFYRRVKILPGITLNVGKYGTSISFGRKGFHYTIGNGKERITIGIPGTGIRYTTEKKLEKNSPEEYSKHNKIVFIAKLFIFFLVLEFTGIALIYSDGNSYIAALPIAFVILILFIKLLLNHFNKKSRINREKSALNKIKELQKIRDQQKTATNSPKEIT